MQRITFLLVVLVVVLTDCAKKDVDEKFETLLLQNQQLSQRLESLEKTTARIHEYLLYVCEIQNAGAETTLVPELTTQTSPFTATENKEESSSEEYITTTVPFEQTTSEDNSKKSESQSAKSSKTSDKTTDNAEKATENAEKASGNSKTESSYVLSSSPKKTPINPGETPIKLQFPLSRRSIDGFIVASASPGYPTIPRPKPSTMPKNGAESVPVPEADSPKPSELNTDSREYPRQVPEFPRPPPYMKYHDNIVPGKN